MPDPTMLPHNVALQFGMAGLFVVVLGMFLNHLQKLLADHRDERESLVKVMKEVTEEYRSAAEKTTETLDRLCRIVEHCPNTRS